MRCTRAPDPRCLRGERESRHLLAFLSSPTSSWSRAPPPPKPARAAVGERARGSAALPRRSVGQTGPRDAQRRCWRLALVRADSKRSAATRRLWRTCCSRWSRSRHCSGASTPRRMPDIAALVYKTGRLSVGSCAVSTQGPPPPTHGRTDSFGAPHCSPGYCTRRGAAATAGQERAFARRGVRARQALAHEALVFGLGHLTLHVVVRKASSDRSSCASRWFPSLVDRSARTVCVRYHADQSDGGPSRRPRGGTE